MTKKKKKSEKFTFLRYLLPVVIILAAIIYSFLRIKELISTGKIFPEPEPTADLLFKTIIASLVLIVFEVAFLVLRSRNKKSGKLTKLLGWALLIGFVVYIGINVNSYKKEMPSLVKLIKKSTELNKEDKLDVITASNKSYYKTEKIPDKNYWVILNPLSISEMIKSKRGIIKKIQNSEDADKMTKLLNSADEGIERLKEMQKTEGTWVKLKHNNLEHKESDLLIEKTGKHSIPIGSNFSYHQPEIDLVKSDKTTYIDETDWPYEPLYLLIPASPDSSKLTPVYKEIKHELKLKFSFN